MSFSPRQVWFVLLFLVCSLSSHAAEQPTKKKVYPPSHLMAGFGIFDVDKDHPRGLAQLEYRWQIGRRGHWRPLAAFFIATDQNFFLCGGIGYDICIGRKVVITPSFSPGIYYHSYGKNLGFPINFRSAIEIAYVMRDKGRFGVQFNHISNARMLVRNPGADSLYIFYAIPFPRKK